MQILLAVACLVACKQETKEVQAPNNQVLSEVLKTSLLMIDSGKQPEVPAYLDSAFSLHTHIADTFLMAKYHTLAFINRYYLKRYLTANQYLDSLEQVYNRGNLSVKNKINLYLLRGDLAFKQNQYDEAFNFFFEGKLLVDSFGDACDKTRYYDALGALLVRQKDYRQALNYYIQVFEIAKLCNGHNDYTQIHNILNSANNSGVILERLNNLDSALLFYKEALSYAVSADSGNLNRANLKVKFEGVILGNIGSVYLKQKKYTEAEELLKKAIAINYHPTREMNDAILVKIKLAQLYLYTGRESMILKEIDDVEKFLASEKSGTSLIRLRLNNLLYEIAYKKGDYEKAIEYKNKEIELQRIVDLKTEHTALERHYKDEYDNLDKKLQLVKLQKDNESKSLLLTTSGIILALIFIVMLITIQKRVSQSKYIKNLEKLNEQISTYNEQLQRSLESLEHSQIENSKLTRAVAHDLRTPIAGIVSLVRMIKQDKPTKEELDELVDLIEKSGNNMMGLIENLLHKKAEHELKFDWCDISELVESCAQLSRNQSDKKHIHLVVETIPQRLQLDQEAIWRVLNNLISNAIKFSYPNSTVYITQTVSDAWVKVSVSDQGIGIPDELKKDLFNPLGKSGRKGTENEKSFGLGLIISKQIIAAHKGKIGFEDNANGGVTFYFELPLEPK